MIDNEVSFTSLCYITVDYEGRIWLNRLADVEDDILHTPFKSERTDNYFENRDRLYRNDGPLRLERSVFGSGQQFLIGITQQLTMSSRTMSKTTRRYV